LTANNKLLNFALNNPNAVMEKTITGLLVDEKFIGIDYRLRTTTTNSGKLYGLTNKANLYTINTDTGMANLITSLKPAMGSSFTTLDGTSFAVDFNPTADRLRVISDSGQNLRINVDTGETFKDVILAELLMLKSLQQHIPIVLPHQFQRLLLNYLI
jgi:hypothetical protein